MSVRINVIRRWKPVGAPVDLLKDQSVTLGTLPSVPVLFLVGEPGAGKTDSVTAFVKEDPAKRVRRTFAEVDSSKTVRSWILESYEKGSDLFIDAYDEHSISYRREFFLEPMEEARSEGKCPLIRVVSRTTHIDQALVSKVKDLFDQEPNRSIVYRLCPLDEAQIRGWVRDRLADADAIFFQEITRNQLDQYLGRPTNLEAFIALFQQNRTLGNSPTEAWSAAIRLELSETNPDRLDRHTNISSIAEPRDRYKIAQILAVSQEVCGVPAVSLNGALGQGITVEGATPASLWESASPLFPHFSKEFFTSATEETLQSRLFELGQDGIHFASAAKAQFLAAQWLLEGEGSYIINLFKDRNEGRRIPEKARPVAAEIAKFHPPLFTWMCENHPDALLQGVVLDFSMEQRAQLTAALLRSSDNRPTWSFYGPVLGALEHDGLHEQLQPYLRGRMGNSKDINLAIEIAKFTKCGRVGKLLGRIANDPKMDLETRVNAAVTVAHLGKEHAEELRPLLKVPRKIDKYDELFGAALTGLWPDGFQPDEAFEILREPQEVAGVYHSFLHSAFDGPGPEISEELLCAGLRWLAVRPMIDAEPHQSEFERIDWALIQLAWERMEYPEIPRLLALIAQARLHDHRTSALPFREPPTFSYSETPLGLDLEEYIDSPDKRWRLFTEWLQLPKVSGDSYDVWRFLRVDELKRLLQLALEAKGDALGVLVSAVENMVFNLVREKKAEEIAALDNSLAAIGIDVDEVKRRFQDGELQRQSHVRPRQRQGFDQHAHKKELFELLERKESDQFPQLLSKLSLDENGWNVSNGNKLLNWSTWKELDSNSQMTAIMMAKRFLKHTPPPPKPSKRRGASVGDRSGLLALILVADYDIEWLKSNPNITKPWLPLLSTQSSDSSMHKHPSSQLFRLYTNEEVCSEILAKIQRQYYSDFDPINTLSASELWRAGIGAFLGIASRSWKLIDRQCFVTILCRHRDPQAHSELQFELQSRSNQRRSFAMRLALSYNRTDLFYEVSKLALEDTKLLEVLWLHLWNSPRLDSSDSVKTLGLPLLKRLFLRSVTEAPTENDIDFRSGFVPPEVHRQRLRDKLLASIASDLSEEAQQFAGGWAGKAPFAWVKDVALTAKQQWLEQSWSPPTLSSLVKLKASRGKHFISTPSDFREMIVETLEQIRPDFEPLEINWKDAAEGKAAEEVPIVTNLAKWLEPRLAQFVVNAEVSCRSTSRTDIQVEAVIEDALGASVHLKCVIEAKKCLNRGLRKALPEQLVAKYISGKGRETGIYLVFWCERCTCSNCKRQAAIIGELEEQALTSGYDISVISFNLRNPSKRQPTAANSGQS